MRNPRIKFQLSTVALHLYHIQLSLYTQKGTKAIQNVLISVIYIIQSEQGNR